MTAFVTAGAGFLLAVLWFDLMFDVQTRRSAANVLPTEVLASISAYYRRVTTDDDVLLDQYGQLPRIFACSAGESSGTVRPFVASMSAAQAPAPPDAGMTAARPPFGNGALVSAAATQTASSGSLVSIKPYLAKTAR